MPGCCVLGPSGGALVKYIRSFIGLLRVEHSRGARMSFLGNTPLSFLSGNSRSSASYDPANNPVQSDSEPEPEPELDAKSMAQRMLDERGAEPSVASALSKVLPWKSVGSAEEQADAVKDKLSYHVRKDRILLLCMAIEDEKATLVQRRWRLKISKRDHRLRDTSAAKLQAAVRGKQARLSHLPEHKVSTQRLTALCTGMANPAPAAPRCAPFAPPPAPVP